MKWIDGERKYSSTVEALIDMFLYEKYEVYQSLEGKGTMRLAEEFDAWRMQKDKEKPNPRWRVISNKLDFTKKVKGLRAIETMRVRRDGKQITMFSVEGRPRYKEPKRVKLNKTQSALFKELQVKEFVQQWEREGNRIIGIRTSDLYFMYRSWLLVEAKYNHLEATQREFTIWVKEERKCETRRKRINGKQVPVFWDSGATRLDLGNYLD